MAIIRFSNYPFFRNPWMDLEKMRREMDLLFQGMERERIGGHSTRIFPALNISEDSAHVYVRAEVPGVSGADLSIFAEGETLTIKGEKKIHSPDAASYHRQEIETGSFSKSITLPVKVNMNQVEAVIKNGILVVTFAKAEEAKPRQIKVNIA